MFHAKPAKSIKTSFDPAFWNVAAEKEWGKNLTVFQVFNSLAGFA